MSKENSEVKWNWRDNEVQEVKVKWKRSEKKTNFLTTTQPLHIYIANTDYTEWNQSIKK